MSFIKLVFLLAVCVVSNAFEITPRIVNGDLAGRGQMPFYVYLQIHEQSGLYYFCGGALITSEFVLTAAHCLKKAHKVSVRAGISSLYGFEPSVEGMVAESSRIHVHPQYVSMPILWNDIGLIHLPRPVRLNRYVQPIQLPENCDSNENMDAIVMGHGSTGPHESGSIDLLYAQLKTTTLGQCRWAYPNLMFRRSVMCAKSENEDKLQSICKGDSGSPLVRIKDNTLIGVSSFGKKNCDERKAQAFTNIILYHKWISEVTGLDLPECQ